MLSFNQTVGYVTVVIEQVDRYQKRHINSLEVKH